MFIANKLYPVQAWIQKFSPGGGGVHPSENFWRAKKKGGGGRGEVGELQYSILL